MPISSQGMSGVGMSAPVSLIPDQRQNPYIGTMVQGLLMNAAVRTTTVFSRNAQATAKTDSVCRPMVGENAMNTPTANARASLWGGSFRLNRDRMRSRIYLLFTWSSPFPPQNAQSFFPFRLETGRTGMGDIIPCLSGFPIK